MSAPLTVPGKPTRRVDTEETQQFRFKIGAAAVSLVHIGSRDDSPAPGVGVRVDVLTLDGSPVDWGLAELGEGCDGGNQCLVECSTWTPAPGLLVEIVGGSAVGWILVARGSAGKTVECEIAVRMLPPDPTRSPAIRLGPAAG